MNEESKEFEAIGLKLWNDINDQMHWVTDSTIMPLGWSYDIAAIDKQGNKIGIEVKNRTYPSTAFTSDDTMIDNHKYDKLTNPTMVGDIKPIYCSFFSDDTCALWVVRADNLSNHYGWFKTDSPLLGKRTKPIRFLDNYKGQWYKKTDGRWKRTTYYDLKS